MPFDEHTPIGYAVGSTIQVGSLILICYTVLLALGIIISYAGLGLAFAGDFKRKLFILNANYKHYRNGAKFFDEFNTLLRLSMEIKELSNITIDFLFDFAIHSNI